MILTLTPNPSLDLLFTAERLVWDDANRIPTPRRRPGGQGLNLVRAVRALDPDAAALAIAPLGGPVGREMREILGAEGTPLRAIDIDGHTRLFVGVRERQSGRSLLLNPPGPRLTRSDGEAILEALIDALEQAPADGGGRVGHGDELPAAGAASPSAGRGWLVCCGSIPPGLPADLYARAGGAARARGFRFVADCDGPALAAAAPLCHLLAPNGHEAGRLTGSEVTDADSALRAARSLHRLGAEVVVITLGEAGAVGVSAEGSWRARPALTPELEAEVADGSAVGAGDAFLAALLLELGGRNGLERALTRAVATGTATLLSRNADLVLRGDIDRLLPHVDTARLP
jgi:fructose-1-phosphate kinase PfkB-like protein